MAAEVGGEEAQAERPLGVGWVGEGAPGRAQPSGVALLPARVCLGQAGERHARAVLLAEEGLAMRQGQQVRLDLKGVMVLLHGFLQPSLGMERAGQGAGGLGQPGLDRQRPPAGRLRLFEPVERLEQTGQVVLGLGGLRLDRQGAAIGRHRLIAPAQGLIGIAQVDLGARQPRLSRQRLPEGRDRFLVSTLGLERHAQAVHGPHEVGLDRECPPVGGFRLCGAGPAPSARCARLCSVSALPGRSARARS